MQPHGAHSPNDRMVFVVEGTSCLEGLKENKRIEISHQSTAMWGLPKKKQLLECLGGKSHSLTRNEGSLKAKHEPSQKGERSHPSPLGRLALDPSAFGCALSSRHI